MHFRLRHSLYVAVLIALSGSSASAFDVLPADWEGDLTPAPGPVGEPGQTSPAEPSPGEKRSQAESLKSGLVVLPTSGIRIELPALNDGATYRVSGRWGLSDSDGSWSRDVIDESRNGNLQGATWYHVGPFKNGSCDAVLDSHGLADAWRTTTTLWGHSFEVAGGSFIFPGNNLGTRPAVIICGGAANHPMLFYRFFFEPGDPTALPKDTILGRLATIPVLRLIAEAHLAGRWSRIKPLHDDRVGTTDLLKYQRQAALSQFSGAVSIPDDGAYWKVDKTETSDYFSRLIPRFPQLGLHLIRAEAGGKCEGVFAANRERSRKNGDKILPTLPSPTGWRAGRSYLESKGEPRTLLCRELGAETLLVEVIHDPTLGDLAETEPLLEAMVAAIGAQPQPQPPAGPTPVAPKPQIKPSPPSSRPVYRDDWAGFGSVDLGVAVSYRDTKALGRSEELFPAVRVAGPGVSMGMTSFETEGGLMFRYQLGLLPDFAGLFDDKAKSSSRWGSQVWEAAIDIGLGTPIGDDDFIGLTVGWHGQSGPLLLNSSIAASFHWIHMPEDDEEFGWALRVTPIQLIPSNERWIMSPLAVDLRLLGDGISFGLEFQWVGKPDLGDQDIPGEGVAAIVRLGFGSFFF